MDIKRFNGKIYCIRSFLTDLIYIGSTCEKRLSARFSKHTYNYKNYLLSGKSDYITSFEIIKHGDSYIELIEECENISKDELRMKEGEHIRKNTCVNKRIEGQTRKKYYEVNKDKIGRTMKEYRETHKEGQKEYREAHKDNMKEYRKIYYETHKDEIKEERKEYYKTHKDEQKEKYKCVCGKSLLIVNKTRHNKVCKTIVKC